MPTITEEAAEAICGGLHAMEFEFLGESEGAPIDSGPTTWWTRGRKPHNVQVAVIRADPFVRVNIAWPNISTPPRIVKGEVVVNIDTRTDRAKLTEATTRAVHKCLELYRDVLEGKGVAGPDAIKRPTF